MKKSTNYIEPKKEHTPNLISVSIFCGFWSLIFSYFYGIFIAFSPFTFINLFICFAFAISIGISIRIGTNIFPISKKKTFIKLAIFFGILAYYFSWSFYMQCFTAEKDFLSFSFGALRLILSPTNWLENIYWIYKNGLWTIFGVTITEFPLLFFWAIEAVLIIAVPIGLNLDHNTSPFSTLLQKRYDKFRINKEFGAFSKNNDFIESLEINCVEAIDKLKLGSAYYYGRIYLFYLKDENKQYLRLENIRRANTQGREDSRILFNCIEISNKDAIKILENFSNTKIKFLHH